VKKKRFSVEQNHRGVAASQCRDATRPVRELGCGRNRSVFEATAEACHRRKSADLAEFYSKRSLVQLAAANCLTS
jgi:hypothetical protein